MIGKILCALAEMAKIADSEQLILAYLKKYMLLQLWCQNEAWKYNSLARQAVGLGYLKLIQTIVNLSIQEAIMRND